MKNSEYKIVRIVESREPSGLSKSQKLFNKLIKQIDQERKQLATWQTTISLYQQKYISELDPLLQNFNELRTKVVHLFDKICHNKAFTKHEKAKIKDVICSISAELLAEKEIDNDALKQIYNTHSGTDFDSEEPE